MNAKKILRNIVIAIIIFCGGVFAGLRFCTTGSAKLKTDITELSKRNKLISSRLLTLEEESRRHTEESRLLAEGIGDLSVRLAEDVRRSKSIEERAERINYLAGVLDKGITALISTFKSISDSSTNTGSDSSR